MICFPHATGVLLHRVGRTSLHNIIQLLPYVEMGMECYLTVNVGWSILITLHVLSKLKSTIVLLYDNIWIYLQSVDKLKYVA